MAYEGIFLGLIGVMFLLFILGYTLRETHGVMSFFFIFAALFFATGVVHLGAETMGADGSATDDMKQTVADTLYTIIAYALRVALFYFIVIDFFFMKVLGLAFSRGDNKISMSPIWRRD